MNANGTTRNVNAGVARILVNGITTLDAFCVDLFELIYTNTTYQANVVTTDVYDPQDGDRAAWLMRTYLPQINLLINGAQKQQWAAALQFAIWDVIHDSGNGFADGMIRSTANTNSTVLTQASTWLAASAGQSYSGRVFVAPTGSRGFQEQMFLAPEPSSLTMMAVGALAIAFGAFRRRRATPES
ncbi:MAG: PEP-CTERM sorting domain-containing protein [Bryobacteraceae bacterium]|nr:PEP-CTERM sorting domain-containing protein [Bryobacteraceae bacterium]